MKRHIIIYFIASLCISVFSSCTDEVPDLKPSESFTRIYDDNLFEASYNPIDVVQTKDGGYLILASRRNEYSDFMGTYILKVDELGKFQQQTDYSETLVHPLDEIFQINGNYYVIAMDPLTLQSKMVIIDESGATGEPVSLEGTIYPLGAGMSDDHLLLQSYNPEDKQTVISEYNLSGNLMKQHAFSIGPGSETEGPIFDHFTGEGKSLPFAAGKIANGLYYFNGFYNYTFSLVFTDLSSDEPQGVTQGQHEDGGLSAIYPLGGDYFALSSFNYGSNFLLPREELNTQGLSSTVDLTGNSFPELVPNAHVRIKTMQLDNANRIIFGSYTQNGQMALYSFDQANGTWQGNLYLGYDNTNELAGFCQTTDGGMAVLGKTYVAGRFGRIVLYKLSSDEISVLKTQK